ncbi:PEP-CTERM sorting domain-containing protein [Lacipirellula limnantheis]|uniref:PEP-CTERM sorting domain-containing protein n=1 Tax=Lacipirellula limnantheis TaxID=2528024 RepID=UPI001AEF9362|nr:PEP-CTERM sorting domain-containing protein [Lacipirellula limnantheis]
MAGGFYRSVAHGVSYDGSVVVGASGSFQASQSFRWTESGGMSALPDGVFNSTFATDISENGLVITGIIGNSGGYRWTQSEGMTALRGGAAYGLSHDGSVIVGGNYRWTNATGSVFLPLSTAKGVSADGSVVAGWFGDGGVTYAARWTEATGRVSLGALPATNSQSFANEISADGSVIVGGSNSGAANDFVAFRWTQSGGMVGLGDLPGGSVQSSAYDVSADGSVVVGTSDSGIPDSFVWTAASGMLNLRDVLAAGGATGFENWTRLYAYGISGDGSTVVGYGRNPNGQDEAFVANIQVPEPTAVSIAMFGVGAVAARRRRMPLACRQ